MKQVLTKLAAVVTVGTGIATGAQGQVPQPAVVQPGQPVAVPTRGAVVVPAQPGGAVVATAQPAVAIPAFNDALFARAAAAGGLAELATSQLALSRSQDEEVRKFAQQMIADHTQVNAQLAQAVANKGIGLPLTLDVKDQAASSALASLQGAAFDREYVKNQVGAHIMAVSLFQAEAQFGQDSQIKGLAAAALPKLQHHLQMSRDLMQKQGGDEHGAPGAPAHDAATPATTDRAPAPAPAEAAQDKSDR
jgi:putative membrane protein